MPTLLRLALSSIACLSVVAACAQQDVRAVEHQRFAGHGQDKDAVVLWPMDILHQRIDLNLALGSIIEGHCTITAVPREDGADHFPLQLLALTVDSVTSPDGDLAYAQVGEDLDIALASTVGTLDTVELTVHYHGDPVVDASGFGGFYTTGQYSYNLGVAFTAVPHSYGRAWFPCADNFTERNSYEFFVTTPATWNAWCNGELLDESQPTPATRLRHWMIEETMPAYLASVAASNYEVVRDTFPSIAGTEIPVTLVARPADTTNMKNSFVHLKDAFDKFEDWFGPYRWDRVGYVLTPQGAMEHPTSIHYPQSIADGSLSYEEIMAHELGHHWFGDLVTCDRPEEMYINEGFAEYLSYLFIEQLYGRRSYLNTVRANHKKMVHQAHQLDEGWWALDSVPAEWTYGEHSYNKGADIIHTLRGYLGDSLFKAGFTSFLDSYAFQPVNTEMMRDHLTQATGVDLTDFFRDWVQQPGWSAFEIRETQATPNGGEWNVHATLGQKLRGPAELYHNVPITLVMVGSTLQEQHRVRIVASGDLTEVDVPCPFEPTGFWLNDDDLISMAITGSTDTISNGGFHSMALANMDLTLPAITDTVLIRAEQYWVGPDNGPVDESFAFIVSPDRYWRLGGQIPEGTTARIFYDGRNVVTGNLDPLLIGDTLGFTFREDSLVMLWREHPGSTWVEWPSSITTLGSATDGYGRITVDSLQAGEYTLAWRKSAVGINDRDGEGVQWTVSPNPAHGSVVVTTERSDASGTMDLLDSGGRMVRSMTVMGPLVRIDLHGLKSGNYHLRFTCKGGGRPTRVGSVVVE